MKRKNKFLPVIRCIIGFLLIIFSISVCILFLSVVGFLKIGTDNGLYQLLMIYLWIPQSVLSVVHILLIVLSGKMFRLRIILICLNAIYIPAYYTAGLTNLPILTVLYVIAIMSVLSTLLFASVHIKSIINKTI